MLVPLAETILAVERSELVVLERELRGGSAELFVGAARKGTYFEGSAIR